MWAVSQLFNGLVQLDSDLNVIPSIAYKWEILNQGLVYRFYLKRDVFFHPHELFGRKKRKVVASDFVYSFKRIMDEKTASPGAWIFHDKVSDEPFIAVNDSVFDIYLNKPFPPFLGLLTMQYCFVVPKEIIDVNKRNFN